MLCITYNKKPYFCGKLNKNVLWSDFMSEAEMILKSMNNAEASINMEGLYVSEEIKELCKRLLNKEISFEEYLDIIKAKLVTL